MNRLVILITVLFITICYSEGYGQNICPNPGFEQLTGCPAGAGEMNLAPPWTNAGALSDLFSFCHVNGMPASCNDVNVPYNFAGHSAAHGGSAYAGFYTKTSVANQRNYIQAPLTSTMVSGQLYKINAFFKRSGNSKYATNRLGIAFSTGPLAQTGNQVIAITPPAEITTVAGDTSNWIMLEAYYQGTGLEDNIAIGNFRNDASTNSFSFSVPAPSCVAFTGAAFYYVDDISVTTISEQLSVNGDTMICAGQSTILTGNTNTSGWWSLQSTPTDTIQPVNPVITVNPAVTTGYIWHGHQSAYTVTVSVGTAPVVILNPDTTVCDGTTVILDATNASSTYLWSTGDTTAMLMAGDSGIYTVAVNNGFCIARDTFNLAVITSPLVNLGEDALICTDNDETIALNAGTGTGYVWSPSGDTTAIFFANAPGIYSVQVSHSTGCTTADTIVITEVCQETLFIPHAFTPNRDNKNDLFYADGTNVISFHIQIFSRWGQPIFSSNKFGIEGGWDGKDGNTEVPAGVYSYRVTYEALKTNGKIKKETRSGYFTLVR